MWTTSLRNVLACLGIMLPILHGATIPDVQCFGTSLMIEDGLSGVSGATLQNRTALAGGGPNIILNGDFNYAANGTNVDLLPTPTVSTPTFKFLPQSASQAGGYLPIANWTGSGGGTSSYAGWNKALTQGTVPSRVFYEGAMAAGASPSCAYFGDGTGSVWRIARPNFDSNGFAISPSTRLSPATGYGTFDTPVNLTQVLSGLTVGKRYRLQFWLTAERCSACTASNPTIYNRTGIAAIEIGGYNRVYMNVSGLSGTYKTIDFVAKSSSPSISFLNWGHVDIYGPSFDGTGGIPGGPTGQATEVALDDVILTQCADSPVTLSPTKVGLEPDRPYSVTSCGSSAFHPSTYSIYCPLNYNCQFLATSNSASTTACASQCNSTTDCYACHYFPTKTQCLTYTTDVPC